MANPDIDFTHEEREFLRLFQSLHHKKRVYTFSKYQRINPALEDFFDWKERGKFWTGEDGVTIYNSATLIGDVSIGKNCWIGPFTMIDGSGSLSIGDNCSISTGVNIVTHDTVKWALSGGTEGYDHAPVRIGNACFIGTHAVITKGVTIGDHCLIGAGAVVTKDVPAFSIVGGVPAQIIGKVTLTDGKVHLTYDKS